MFFYIYSFHFSQLIMVRSLSGRTLVCTKHHYRCGYLLNILRDMGHVIKETNSKKYRSNSLIYKLDVFITILYLNIIFRLYLLNQIFECNINFFFY